MSLICGTYNFSTVKSTGSFHCPACKTQAPYKRKEYHKVCHFQYIPLIPCGSQDLVKCSRCKNRFDPEELAWLKARAQAKAESQQTWNLAVLRAMVALAMVDGEMKQSEIDCIRATYHAVTNSQMSHDTIEELAKKLDGSYGQMSQDVIVEIAKKLDHCSSPGDDVEAELRPFVKIVPHAKKFMAVKGLCLVAYADGGELRDDQLELIHRVASTLWVSRLDVDRELSALQEKLQKAQRVVAVAGKAEKQESSLPLSQPPFPDAPAKTIKAQQGAMAVAEKQINPPQPPIPVAPAKEEEGARVVVTAEAKKQKSLLQAPIIPVAPTKTIAEEAHDAVVVEAEKQKKRLLPPPIPDALAMVIAEEAASLSLETLMASIDNYRRGKWDQRASYMQAAVDRWADKAVTKGCPNSAAGDLFRGVLMIDRAWEARGGSGMASAVPRQRARAYLLCLEMAREALLRSAERDPEDPTPYAFLAGPIAAGLQVGQEQAREWFLAAVKRDPFNYVAHAGRLQTLCLKWGGSHAAMHEFAEETVRKAPHDSLLRTIRYQAFYEQWFFHESIAGDTTSANNYLSDVDVQKETLAIFRQVLEKDSIQDMFQCVVHMNATKWLISCGQDEAANAELNKLRPWRRLLDEDLRNKQARVVDGGHPNTAGSNENAPASTEAGITGSAMVPAASGEHQTHSPKSHPEATSRIPNRPPPVASGSNNLSHSTAIRRRQSQPKQRIAAVPAANNRSHSHQSHSQPRIIAKNQSRSQQSRPQPSVASTATGSQQSRGQQSRGQQSRTQPRVVSTGVGAGSSRPQPPVASASHQSHSAATRSHQSKPRPQVAVVPATKNRRRNHQSHPQPQTIATANQQSRSQQPRAQPPVVSTAIPGSSRPQPPVASSSHQSHPAATSRIQQPPVASAASTSIHGTPALRPAAPKTVAAPNPAPQKRPAHTIASVAPARPKTRTMRTT